MKSLRWVVSYILVASLGLWAAFAVSMKFMTPASAQGNAPASGDLPAEFLKEMESTQVPGKPDAKDLVPPTPDTATPPPAAAPTPGGGPAPTEQPSAPPAESMPSQVPAPPPGMDAPVGDGATAAPAQQFIPKDDYFYDPTGKRDPFKVFRTVRPTTATPADSTVKHQEVLEPLQRWELERLQIVGILWDVKKPRAMVRDPDGTVYTVVKNSKIGRNEGFVAAIREGEIVVMETRYEDGKSLKEPRILELKK
ncbi:pilus assembly protein PilP [Bdellovibrio bacteriovorus]